jgi:hypothetical protein
MIEFNSKKFISKLEKAENNDIIDIVTELLTEGETIIADFKHGHDAVAFTSKRIVVIRLSGAHGKNKDFTFIPYTTVNTYAVDHAGLVELVISSSGIAKLGFKNAEDAKEIAKAISAYILV